MRVLLAVCVIAACVVSAALAQEAPPPAEAEPEAAAPPAVQLRWARRPDGRDFANNYPSRAVDDGIPGAAVMCCTVLATGRLDCTVPFEWPRGYGFGEATLAISREFRLSEENAAELAGGRIRRQVVWLIGSRTPELDAALARIREGTANLCGPPVDWSQRAPGDVIVTADAPGS